MRDGVVVERPDAERDAENLPEEENWKEQALDLLELWQEQALNFLRNPETLAVLSNTFFASALFMGLCGSIHNAMQPSTCSRVKCREPEARAERNQEREREREGVS
jgi:hypothetical protein